MVISFGKFRCNLIVQLVPEILMNFVMNAGIANNGEVMLLEVYMKKHRVSFRSFILAKCFEDFKRLILRPFFQSFEDFEQSKIFSVLKSSNRVKLMHL